MLGVMEGKNACREEARRIDTSTQSTSLPFSSHLISPNGSWRASLLIEAVCRDQPPKELITGLENESCEQAEDIQDTYTEINRHYHLYCHLYVYRSVFPTVLASLNLGIMSYSQ